MSLFLNQVCPVQMTDVGNDHCDAAANIAECDYDEGDCCPRKDNGCDDCLCYKPFNKTGTIQTWASALTWNQLTKS